jgi:hypothetical protein
MDNFRSEFHVIFGAGALGMAIAHQLHTVSAKRRLWQWLSPQRSLIH